MIQFAIEKLQPIWPQIHAIAAMHWQETENYRHGQPFAPDAYRYFQFNEIPGIGGLQFYTMFTARDEGRLVGYAGMYLTTSMHSQVPIAFEDTWFLLPEYRKGRNAIRFYQYVEAACQKAGIEEIGMTAKLTNGAGRILEYLGYSFTSKQYTKDLKHRADSAISEPVESGAAMLSETRDAIPKSESALA